ncbi:MAG: HD-GYP domain-containing protein [Planctomycetota bacterium]|jgi:HD-GYP domain-containing protein (c-di-GMP phosphodiesterase class II)
MAVATDDKPAKADARGFLPIAIDTLAPTPTLDFDLYIRPEAAGPVVMFRERSYPLEGGELDRLTDAGVETLYIPVAAHEAYRTYLRDSVIHNDQLTPQQRYKVLRIANRAVFQAVFRRGNIDEMVELAEEIGHQMVDLVCDQNLVLSNLLPLMAHDYYTYTHVTNVCTYCLALATTLGVSDQQDLLDVAEGALLHDLGKRMIPPAVLNHPGKLSDKQWAIVRRHPTDGFRDLCGRDDLSWGQLMMVYQHHERLDGKGYPVGLGGEEIHPWARICKVADVFDALTSDRPYRKAEPVAQVLDFFTQRMGTEFDEEMVRCLKATVQKTG